MKQKPTFKSLLVAFSIFSLFAFVFVNASAAYGSTKSGLKTEFVPTQLEEVEEEDAGKISVPDVTLLGRLWDIAHKLIDRKN